MVFNEGICVTGFFWRGALQDNEEGKPPSGRGAEGSFVTFKKKHRWDLSWTSFVGHSLLNAQAR